MKLKELRLRCGLTQPQAAKLVGVPFRTYCRYEDEEAYKGSFKYETISKILELELKNKVLTSDEISKLVSAVCRQYPVSACYLFGSYARGEAKGTSDVDIYCASGDIKTLIDQGYFEDELRNALGKEVDVVFLGATLGDYFNEQLEADKIRIC